MKSLSIAQIRLSIMPMKTTTAIALFPVFCSCFALIPLSSAKDWRKAKFSDERTESFAHELKAAVKAGKLSEEAAWKKWKHLTGERKQARHEADDPESIGRKIKAALAAGKISEKEAHQKWQAVKGKSRQGLA